MSNHSDNNVLRIGWDCTTAEVCLVTAIYMTVGILSLVPSVFIHMSTMLHSKRNMTLSNGGFCFDLPLNAGFCIVLYCIG